MHTDAKRFYAILDLEPSASDDAIRHAFRRRAKELHPDAPTGHAESFILLKRAYDTLSEHDTRLRYDRDCQTILPHAATTVHRRPPPPPPMPALREPRRRGGMGFARYVIAFVVVAAISIGGVQAMIFFIAAPPSIRTRDAGASGRAPETAAAPASSLPGSTSSGFWDPTPAAKK